MYNIQIITYWSLCCSLTFHYFQDDTYTESYISTIGVDFVSTIYTLTLSFISTTVALDLNIDLNIAQYVTYWFKRIIHHINAFHFKGGVQAFQIWKHDFDPWVGGDGLDMNQQLECGFGSMCAILSMWGLGPKNGSKTANLQEWDSA